MFRVSKITGPSQVFSPLILTKVTWKIELRLFLARKEMKKKVSFWPLIFQATVKLIYQDFKKPHSILGVSLQIIVITSNKIG